MNIKSLTKDIKRLVLETVLIVAVLLMILLPVDGDSYRVYGEITQRCVPGTVTEVISEELYDSPFGTAQKLGSQQLKIRLQSGKEVQLKNYLTDTHNVHGRVGLGVIVWVDEPEGTEPFYTLYTYDRTLPVILIVAVFTALLILVGKRKGFDSFLAIVFTLVFILKAALPMIYNGISPIFVGLVTVLLSTAVTLLLIHGFTSQCLIGIGTTLTGEAAACLLFLIFSSLLHISGLQTDNAEALFLITQHTGMDIRTLLIASMMIASLGAVMDVAVSILSSLREVAEAGKSMGRAELFKSGMSIGKDLIGTMSNTLIFAFAGGALTSMLVFYSWGVQTAQLFHSDYLAVELSQGLCSTMAVILTVPSAAAAGAAFFGKKR